MVKQYVFINTEEEPLAIRRAGAFEYQIRGDKLLFSELCELDYKHPDAPEDAIITVYRWLDIEVKEGTEVLIKNAIDAVRGIGKITKL
jgi:hypothetical protein